MKNKNVSLIVLSILVIALSTRIISYKAASDKTAYSDEAGIVLKVESLENRLFETSKNLQLKINDSVAFYTEDEKSISLSEILNGRPKLFLFIKPDFCNTCIVDAIDKINMWTPKFGPQNVVVLIETKYYNQFIRTRSDFGISNPTYGLRTGELFINFRYLNAPTYFIVRDNYYMSDFFIPLPNFPEITDNYFNQIIF